ncbi:MAG: radical SAM protein [Lachnospiraceae bacterium]|nr:radical SAM protein [Lachnospiraceae bacterium]
MILYENCKLCPRECGVNRSEKKGICNSTNKCKIVRAALHFWEEPCISGIEGMEKSGSGTIFFEGCSLGCVFCQNYEISDGKAEYGVEVSVDRLVEIFFELKEKGAYNINFVTPTHFMPHIKQAILMAKERGFDLPFVYNSSGYEKVECIKELEGLIDVYLPDMKYAESIGCSEKIITEHNIAKEYSRASDYFARAKEAIAEMYGQVGAPQFDEHGLIKKGVIVRHLILPNHTKNSMKVIEYLYNTYKDDIYISIMNQYTPVKTPRMEAYPKLQRVITKREYEKVIDFTIELGVKNAFIQEGGTCKESFIPDFNGEGAL